MLHSDLSSDSSGDIQKHSTAVYRPPAFSATPIPIGAAQFHLLFGGMMEVCGGLEEMWSVIQGFGGRAGETSFQVMGCS
jgi:hypothetical protein